MKIIILAAGHGKRMQSELPKPLVPVHGKAMITYVMESIVASGVSDGKPIVVISPNSGDLIKAEVGSSADYAIQEEQLGTGHAVMAAASFINDYEGPVMVLYADQPTITPETLQNIAQTFAQTGAHLTLATVTVPDFDDWRAGFYSFSRVIRDEAGNIVRTVEKKDASEEQLTIHEVNPCYMCFDAAWLRENLQKIGSDNAQSEYYLTDLIGMAVAEGDIGSINIKPIEALGANTPEQRDMIERVLTNQS